ncbi:hypothetical protein CVT24_008875 [Panaeolus cyanescens]|uniref:Protein HRI1 n=1 Tax=Panaeolus cyanescens TaxID=181874 RepID=A0A409VAX4_9AGAR|nr:hypothetical protein CVT24_008875 [Panaeolus cyanescens]
MSVSTRLSIRWLPEPASEPTSTIVLTLPKTKLYIDIRLSVSEPSLYWGFAGYSTHVGNKCTFSHFMDSRGLIDAIDSGIFTTQPDGTTLETGSMMNFDTGKVEDYEEIWFDETREEYIGLVSAEGEAKGALVRVGEWWQGMVYENNEFRSARWRKDGDNWEMIWGVEEDWDHGKPPGNSMLEGLAVGQEVQYAGKRWRTVESSSGQ